MRLKDVALPNLSRQFDTVYAVLQFLWRASLDDCVDRLDVRDTTPIYIQKVCRHCLFWY